MYSKGALHLGALIFRNYEFYVFCVEFSNFQQDLPNQNVVRLFFCYVCPLQLFCAFTSVSEYECCFVMLYCCLVFGPL